MSIILPSNKINFQYTIGKEYMYESNYIEYQGYYYEINNRFFVGNEFNTNAPTLIKINSDNVNLLKINPKTTLYSKISNASIVKNELPSIPLIFLSEDKYLAKKLNSNPIRIFFISKDTFEKNNGKNSLYSFTKVQFDEEWGFEITSQNKKDIPEIDIFLKQYSSNPE